MRRLLYCKYALSNDVYLSVVLPIRFVHPTGKKIRANPCWPFDISACVMLHVGEK